VDVDASSDLRDVGKMSAVTIYDVANLAGVSIKTVSRVLNNEAGVRDATRETVRQAVKSLGYHPNLSARNLAGSRSYVIVTLVDADLTIHHWRGARAADFLTRVQLGATVECRNAGYHFMIELIGRDPVEMVAEVRGTLGALKPDGVLLTPPSSDDAVVLDLLKAARVPYVRLGSQSAGGGGLRLVMDDKGAARAITEHLIELGHTRIGLILGEPHYGASLARFAGFREALEANGLAVDDSLIRPGDFTYESGVESATSLLALPNRPTAIFACSDDMALGCLGAIAEAGLTAPQDISVAGFDDSAGARFSNPPLTTVGHPLDDLAALAVRSLVSGEVSVDEEKEIFAPLPFRLTVRRSTGPAPQ